MLYIKFHGNWPASSGEDFLRVFTIYGHGGHLGHVQIGTVVSEKIGFEFLYVQDLGPRSRNDLGLQYSYTFINSFRCPLLPTFRSLAAIVSEKSTVFTFSYRKT